MAYSEYSAGYRNAMPGIATNAGDGLSKWVTLNKELKMSRYSGCFVGMDGTGKIVLVSGANTTKTVMGWLQGQKFEDSESSAATDVGNITHKVGSKLALFSNAQLEFNMKVDGANLDAIKASIAAMSVGSTFGLKVNASGEQVVDPADTTNVVVVVISTTLPGKDMIRVKMIPSAITLVTT